MKVIWSDTAKDDYKELLFHIAEQSYQNAVFVQTRIENSLSLLTDFNLGIPVKNTKFIKHYIPKTSYFVVYKILDDNTVKLLAFIHSSRDWDHISPYD